MTGPEFASELNANMMKQESARRKIADYARTLIPVLHDAGRAHSAKELERLLFELEVLEGESLNLGLSNPGAMREFLLSLTRGGI